jgi:RNA polymerase sigma-70 factor (ECF subfamily)
MERTSLYKSRHRRASTAKEAPALDEERILVLRAARHDAEAFAQLYDRFVEKIYKYIYYKVGSKSDAEDLTAQVFLKAWEALGHYRLTERPFSAWLYRIAHNLVVDHFRMRREAVPIDEVTRIDGKDGDLDDVTQRHLTAETLRRAIHRLTNDQQQVIILRFLEGYSTEEVARIMGKGQGAVRTLQHRALAALARIFRRGSEQL